MKKSIKIVHRKLGKYQAYGLAWQEDRTIEIDERLRGYEHLETFIHELLHIQNPVWPEMKVRGHAKEMAGHLWKHNYRRVEQ